MNGLLICAARIVQINKALQRNLWVKQFQEGLRDCDRGRFRKLSRVEESYDYLEVNFDFLVNQES